MERIVSVILLRPCPALLLVDFFVFLWMIVGWGWMG
jgi:hypothetical protein